ncbi:hypothetical protein ACN25Y_002480, partial [Vibrio cholerae]
NYRLSSVPVFIFYDFQSSNASRRSLYLSLFAFIQRVYSINSLVELIHQSLYTLFDWEKSVNKCSQHCLSFKSTKQGVSH